MIDQSEIDASKFESPIKKGDKPLSDAQFVRRMNAAKNRILPPIKQLEILATDSDLAKRIGEAMAAAQATAFANNEFNIQLADYRKAVARLARYRLADGQPEITEERETGDFDEQGASVLETVVVQQAIAPLDAEIEQVVIGPETGEKTDTEMVPNPLIVLDDAERDAEQAVIAATPEQVRDFKG